MRYAIYNSFPEDMRNIVEKRFNSQLPTIYSSSIMIIPHKITIHSVYRKDDNVTLIIIVLSNEQL